MQSDHRDVIRFQYSQLKPKFHHLLLAWRDWNIHLHPCSLLLKKVKAEATFCMLGTPVSIFGTHLGKKLWQPSLPILISQEQRVKLVEICTKVLKLWSAVFHVEQDHSLQTVITPLLIVNICSPAHLWTFRTNVLQFFLALHFGCKLR
jgi:hypothetical protein